MFNTLIRRRHYVTTCSPTPSFTELGAAFEHLCIQILRPFGISLEHVGGRGDGGVDMRGKWNFSDGNSVGVIVQCKNIGKKCGPNVVRELEGVMSGLQSSSYNNHNLYKNGIIGFLACSSVASEQTRDRIETSQHALAYLHIEENALIHVHLSDGFRSSMPDLLVSIRYGLEPNTMTRTESPLFVYKGNVCTE